MNEVFKFCDITRDDRITASDFKDVLSLEGHGATPHEIKVLLTRFSRAPGEKIGFPAFIDELTPHIL
jgi:Ca2+-binding EF-hand superfamily protein